MLSNYSSKKRLPYYWLLIIQTLYMYHYGKKQNKTKQKEQQQQQQNKLNFQHT